MAGSRVHGSKRFVENLKVVLPNEWDITGKPAKYVIRIFKTIVNNRNEYKRRKEFSFMIKRERESLKTISFKLEANPKRNQPGNGRIFTKHSEGKFIPQDYRNLNSELSNRYGENTKRFAEDIKLAFQNNTSLFEFEDRPIIRDAYMILLFEIGRRLVQVRPVNKERQALDNLPISGAITEMVKLLEEGKFTFADFFAPPRTDMTGQFHFFSGAAKKRKEAIDRMGITDDLKEIEEMFGGDGGVE